jgi:hypothetical protein
MEQTLSVQAPKGAFYVSTRSTALLNCLYQINSHAMKLARDKWVSMARPQVADGATASNMEGSCRYSGTSVHERLSLRTNRFTNKFSEQKPSRVTNGISSNEHASRQQRLATSWEYRRESVSCCVTFAQYTTLLEFAVPSLEFHRVLWFFKYIIK